jgi:hypothetical protein
VATSSGIGLVKEKRNMWLMKRFTQWIDYRNLTKKEIEERNQ